MRPLGRGSFGLLSTVAPLALLVALPGGCGLGRGGSGLSSTAPSACDDPRAIDVLDATRLTRARGAPVTETMAFTTPFEGQFCVVPIDLDDNTQVGKHFDS